MKKLFSLAISLTVLLSLFTGCAGSGSDGSSAATQAPIPHAIQVGFGRVDISPEESVPLRGYGNTSDRMSTEITDPIYATCIAFTDEKDNTFLLFHTDLIGGAGDGFIWARSDIAKATGIPLHQIMISGTHMHSGPDMANTKEPSIERYIVSFRKWCVKAAQEALADRKPADFYTAEAFPEGYNFVRHYVVDDGEVIGDNFGSLNGRTYTGHTHKADNQMQLIKITREGAEDIVMVNWQGHPHRAGGSKKYNVTSDLVGAMRDYVEKNLGCKFAYFTGASGNVNSSSRIKSEMAADNYISHGQQLGQIAIDALKNCKPAEEGTVQMATSKMSIENKAGNGTREAQLYAFSIGEIGFVCAPYEMFDINGVEIKTGSKFDTTFVVTCANAYNSYIPSISAYQYQNSEEPYEVKSCLFIPGTGEVFAQEFVKMLNTLHETRK